MPIGSVGEICIAGKGLAQGYFELPEQTAAAFIDHPFAPGKRLYKITEDQPIPFCPP